MYFDHENLFSWHQAVTTTAPSDNVIDFGRNVDGHQKDVGPGTPVQLDISVSEPFEGCTALKVSIETSADEAFTTPVTLLSTADVPVAQLKQAYRFAIGYLPDGCLRYVRLKYTVTGTATSGKIIAGVVADRQNITNMGGR